MALLLLGLLLLSPGVAMADPIALEMSQDDSGTQTHCGIHVGGYAWSDWCFQSSGYAWSD
jgi:hypothetical protein